MNEVIKHGPTHYDEVQIYSAYNHVHKQYNNFALQETSKPWWNAFLAKLQVGDLVLDLGCGSGIPARYLASKGMRVIGIDISSEMILLAKKQVPGVPFICADMEKTQWPKDAFGGICAFFSLLHLPKKRTIDLLHNVYKWLRPGGILAVTVVVGTEEGLCDKFMGEDVVVYLSYYTKEELVLSLCTIGFSVTAARVLNIKTKNFEETELFVLAKKPMVKNK